MPLSNGTLDDATDQDEEWSVQMASRLGSLAALLLATIAFAPLACGGDKLSASTLTPDPTGVDAEIDPDASTGQDGPVVPPFDDGTPTRMACTSKLGSGLVPAKHGRLDGQLVAVVVPNTKRCPSDNTHLHLQVLASGSIYDIAINLDGLEGEINVKLPGPPFAEGWHPTVDLDYPTDLGLHSPALTLTGIPVILARLQEVLAKANHVSVFGTPYPGSDGAHLIHRTGGLKEDGAVVINPGAPLAHVLAFRFDGNTF